MSVLERHTNFIGNLVTNVEVAETEATETFRLYRGLEERGANKGLIGLALDKRRGLKRIEELAGKTVVNVRELFAARARFHEMHIPSDPNEIDEQAEGVDLAVFDILGDIAQRVYEYLRVDHAGDFTDLQQEVFEHLQLHHDDQFADPQEPKSIKHITPPDCELYIRGTLYRIFKNPSGDATESSEP